MKREPLRGSNSTARTSGKGASRRVDVDRGFLAQLNAGTVQTRTLAEGLAIDFAKLLHVISPEVSRSFVDVGGPSLGIVKRMQLAGRMLAGRLSARDRHALMKHASDTVRGWAAFAIDLDESADRVLERIRPLADDSHFGVREWAWLAVRPAVARDLETSLDTLQSWTGHASDNERRFASEVTRPRGVWCAHIPALIRNPDIATDLLDALHADPSRYVQNSVANWLNDAGKSKPDWVGSVCDRWTKRSKSDATGYIVRRAKRNLS